MALNLAKKRHGVVHRAFLRVVCSRFRLIVQQIQILFDPVANGLCQVIVAVGI